MKYIITILFVQLGIFYLSAQNSLEYNKKIKFELYVKDKLKLTETLKYSYHDKGIAIKGKSKTLWINSTYP